MKRCAVMRLLLERGLPIYTEIRRAAYGSCCSFPSSCAECSPWIVQLQRPKLWYDPMHRGVFFVLFFLVSVYFFFRVPRSTKALHTDFDRSRPARFHLCQCAHLDRWWRF